jgi:acyl-ACP thioesterase
MIEEGKFVMPIQVPIHMVDSRVEMTPVSLFCILQESAAAHCDHFHLSGIDLKPYNLFWVLTRMHVHVERMPQWHEKLTIKTWEKPHSFISQPRDFLVFDEAGEIVVRGTSIWAIIDKESKPVKLEDFDRDDRFPLKDDAMIVKSFPRLPAAPMPENPVYHKVQHSDIDLNEHVNNTKYLQWVMDEMGHDFFLHHDIQEVSVHFISQLFPGNQYFMGHQQLDETGSIHSVYAADDQREVCRIWMRAVAAK